MLENACRFQLPKGYTHLFPIYYADRGNQGYGDPTNPNGFPTTTTRKPFFLLASGRYYVLCFNLQTAELSLYRLQNGRVTLIWSEEFSPGWMWQACLMLVIEHGGLGILLVSDGASVRLFYIAPNPGPGLTPCPLEPPSLSAPEGPMSGSGGITMEMPLTQAVLMPYDGEAWPWWPSFIFYRASSGASFVNFGTYLNAGWGYSEKSVMIGATPGLTSLAAIGGRQQGFMSLGIMGLMRGTLRFYAKDLAFIGAQRCDISQEDYEAILATGWGCQVWRCIGAYEAGADYTGVVSLDDLPGGRGAALLYDGGSGRYELVRVHVDSTSVSEGPFHAETFEVTRLGSGQFGSSPSPAVAASIFHTLFAPGVELGSGVVNERMGWLFRYTAEDGLLDVDKITLDW